MQSPDFQAEPFTEREAFLWSIEQAAHGPHLQFFNGVEIAVERGEFATSSRKMSAVFQWGDKRTRLFTARMVRRGKWAQRPAQQGAHVATVLRVCNYERFQSVAMRKGAAEGAEEGAARAQLGRSEDAQQKEGINNGNEGKAKEREAAPQSRALVPALPIADAVSAWSQAAALKGWSPVHPTLPLTPDRRRELAATLKVHGLDGWKAGIQRACDSAMLGGHHPPAWFNFSFVIQPKNFVKLIEGNYDATFTRDPAGNGKGSAWLAARNELRQSA